MPGPTGPGEFGTSSSTFARLATTGQLRLYQLRSTSARPPPSFTHPRCSVQHPRRLRSSRLRCGHRPGGATQTRPSTTSPSPHRSRPITRGRARSGQLTADGQVALAQLSLTALRHLSLSSRSRLARRPRCTTSPGTRMTCSSHPESGHFVVTETTRSQLQHSPKQMIRQRPRPGGSSRRTRSTLPLRATSSRTSRKLLSPTKLSLRLSLPPSVPHGDGLPHSRLRWPTGVSRSIRS